MRFLSSFLTFIKNLFGKSESDSTTDNDNGMLSYIKGKIMIKGPAEFAKEIIKTEQKIFLTKWLITRAIRIIIATALLLNKENIYPLIWEGIKTNLPLLIKLLFHSG